MKEYIIQYCTSDNTYPKSRPAELIRKDTSISEALRWAITELNVKCPDGYEIISVRRVDTVFE